MASTVYAVFPTAKQADRAVRRLLEEGFAGEGISIAAAREGLGAEWEPLGVVTKTDSETDNAMIGAAAGGAVGAAGGWFLGAAMLAFPGVIPLVVTGPLFGAVAGLVTGAGAGGLLGALMDRGLPAEHAERFQSHVHAGQVLVAVDAPGREVEAHTLLVQEGGHETHSPIPVEPLADFSSPAPDAEPPASVGIPSTSVPAASVPATSVPVSVAASEPAVVPVHEAAPATPGIVSGIDPSRPVMEPVMQPVVASDYTPVASAPGLPAIDLPAPGGVVTPDLTATSYTGTPSYAGAVPSAAPAATVTEDEEAETLVGSSQ